MNQRTNLDQLKETIREQSDLLNIASEYLPLKKSGQNHTALCPFHQEKTPSFTVSSMKQIFYCYGCGTGGDVFTFLMKMEDLSFPESLQRLAERAGIPLPENSDPKNPSIRSEFEEIYELNEVATDYFHQNLMENPQGKEARLYLKDRGVTTEMMKRFSIGFALSAWDPLSKTLGKRFNHSLLEKAGLIVRKKMESQKSARSDKSYDRFRNRVIFPIQTSRGKIAGFGGRVLDDSMPKYLNTPETPVFTKGKHLFGLQHVKRKGLHPLVVVEGYLDAISAHQTGIPNVVATLGTALTGDHLNLIRRLTEKVTLVFDGDEAGRRAAFRAVPLLLEKSIAGNIVSLPPEKDPDLLIRESGKEMFLKMMDEGVPPIDFSIFYLLRSKGPSSIEDKVSITPHIFPLIDRLNSQVVRSHYLKTLAEALNLPEEDLRADYAKWKKGRPSSFPQQPKTTQRERPHFPQDQAILLALLLQEKLSPSALNRKIVIEDFTDPKIQRIISHYWETQSKTWVLPNRFELEDPESETLLRHFSLLEIGDGDQMERIGEDCIRKLQIERFDRERALLELKQKENTGNSKFCEQLQVRILDLKKASSRLAVNHS
ncbi:MAG: DNA primase [Nitrospiria bacterium]